MIWKKYSFMSEKNIVFIQSMEFMNSSLGNLVKKLTKR